MTDKISLTRRAITQGLALGLPAFSVSAAATTARAQSAPSSVPPGKDWEALAPEAAGFTREGLTAVERSIYALPTTSLMVVTSGKVVYHYGFTAQVSYLASARKSILSMLYGKYVANGTINLDRTIEELGIEEDKGLLPIEKTARVRDLLIGSCRCLSPGWKSWRRRNKNTSTWFKAAGHVLSLQQLGLQRPRRHLREADRQDSLSSFRRGSRSAAPDAGLRSVPPTHDGLSEPVTLFGLSSLPVGAGYGTPWCPHGQ